MPRSLLETDPPLCPLVDQVYFSAELEFIAVERVCAYASLAPEDQAIDDNDSTHQHMVQLYIERDV